MVYGLTSAIDSSPFGLIDGGGGKQPTRPRFRHEFLPFRVDPFQRAEPFSPFAPPALPGINATMGRSDPVPRLGTVALGGHPLVAFPCHRGRQDPPFPARARAEITPPLCRSPPSP